jgi:hypothetical protein
MQNQSSLPIEIAMSSTRLFESLKAEVRRLQLLSPNAMTSEEETLVRRWNAHARALGKKLDAAKAARALQPSASEWFYSQSWAVR